MGKFLPEVSWTEAVDPGSKDVFCRIAVNELHISKKKKAAEALYELIKALGYSYRIGVDSKITATEDDDENCIISRNARIVFTMDVVYYGRKPFDKGAPYIENSIIVVTEPKGGYCLKTAYSFLLTSEGYKFETLCIDSHKNDRHLSYYTSKGPSAYLPEYLLNQCRFSVGVASKDGKTDKGRLQRNTDFEKYLMDLKSMPTFEELYTVFRKHYPDELLPDDSLVFMLSDGYNDEYVDAEVFHDRIQNYESRKNGVRIYWSKDKVEYQDSKTEYSRKGNATSFNTEVSDAAMELARVIKKIEKFQRAVALDLRQK